MVGIEGRRYLVHKALLCKRVEYFKSAYNTSLKEVKDNVFTFEDLSVDGFGMLVTWPYSGKIYPSADGEHDVPRAFSRVRRGNTAGQRRSSALTHDIDFVMGSASEGSVYSEEEFGWCC